MGKAKAKTDTTAESTESTETTAEAQSKAQALAKAREEARERALAQARVRNTRTYGRLENGRPVRVQCDGPEDAKAKGLKEFVSGGGDGTWFSQETPMPVRTFDERADVIICRTSFVARPARPARPAAEA